MESGADTTGAKVGTDAEGNAVDPVIAQRTRFIERNPDSAVTYNDRGFAYEERGEYKLAIADYDKAIERKPDSPLTLNNRGHAYAKSGEYELAIADYTKALEVDSSVIRRYIYQLRRKLNDVPPRLIVNEPGRGYKFNTANSRLSTV